MWWDWIGHQKMGKQKKKWLEGSEKDKWASRIVEDMVTNRKV